MRTREVGECDGSGCWGRFSPSSRPTAGGPRPPSPWWRGFRLIDGSSVSSGLSGQATVMVDCFGASLPMLVEWDQTLTASFDLPPNGSSGTVIVPQTFVTATDCLGNPVAQSLGLSLTFDAGGKADATGPTEAGSSSAREPERSSLGRSEPSRSRSRRRGRTRGSGYFVSSMSVIRRFGPVAVCTSSHVSSEKCSHLSRNALAESTLCCPGAAT